MRHNQNSPKIPPAWSLPKGAIEIEVCNLYAFSLLAAAVLQSVDRAHDFITMLAPSTRVNCGCITTKAREEGANMIIIGADFHPSMQEIAFLDQETGEYVDRQLNHSDGEAEKFYREMAARGVRVRVGMEATGYSRWLERLLAELGIEVWIGDAAKIKAKRVRKQKNDREDARLMLRLLRENNFPRIWVPTPENRDLRQLLWHRHRLVQMRTRIMNQLQAVAMNEGYRWKKKLFSEQGRAQLEKLTLAPWASRRRQQLLELLDRLNPTIEELTAAVEREARKRPAVQRLMTHPGVGLLEVHAKGFQQLRVVREH